MLGKYTLLTNKLSDNNFIVKLTYLYSFKANFDV